MNRDDMLICKSEGAKHIEAFCRKTVEDLGWELVENEPMAWSCDFAPLPKSYILNIEVKNGITTKTQFCSISFSYKEIEDCKSGVTQQLGKKIRTELEKLGSK